MKSIENPILPGFYPDPSICRVGEDFYLVTSSFAFFPGVPVFHSRDLIHWEQIGHVLTRPEQLPLNCRHISGGIYAPTLRYFDGTFYMITTNVDGIGDFVCTAQDPAGPWSDMHIVHGAPGIDPSLFFDDDGSCWMCGNDWSKGYGVIWVAPFDTKTFSLCGERVDLWRGAMHDAWAPEAPHIYKKDGWYYLMIAEGGTEFFHSETIARAESITGKYKGYPGNPILTHRHLGYGAPITNTGHADLVELADGSWYMVLLACRPIEGYHLNMGRETFITPVTWQNGWPVVNERMGQVTFTVPAPNLPECPFPETDSNDFRSLCWNYLGTPASCTDPVEVVSGSHVRIRATRRPFIPHGEAETPEEQKKALGFYGRRQQHRDFTAAVTASLPEDERARCGLVLLQNDFASLRLELYRVSGAVKVRAVKACCERNRFTQEAKPGGTPPCREETLFECPAAPRSALKLAVSGQHVRLLCGGEELAQADASFLGSETSGGFIGAYIGLYACGGGEAWADFEDFQYCGTV